MWQSLFADRSIDPQQESWLLESGRRASGPRRGRRGPGSGQWRRPGISRESRVSAAVTDATAAGSGDEDLRAFWLEGFRDYLALEAGHSQHTVENYGRDLRRLAEFARSKGITGTGEADTGPAA